MGGTPTPKWDPIGFDPHSGFIAPPPHPAMQRCFSLGSLPSNVTTVVTPTTPGRRPSVARLVWLHMNGAVCLAQAVSGMPELPYLPRFKHQHIAKTRSKKHHHKPAVSHCAVPGNLFTSGLLVTRVPSRSPFARGFDSRHCSLCVDVAFISPNRSIRNSEHGVNDTAALRARVCSLRDAIRTLAFCSFPAHPFN